LQLIRNSFLLFTMAACNRKGIIFFVSDSPSRSIKYPRKERSRGAVAQVFLAFNLATTHRWTYSPGRSPMPSATVCPQHRLVRDGRHEESCRRFAPLCARRRVEVYWVVSYKDKATLHDSGPDWLFGNL
jgi:hypothetical protein